MALQMTVDTLDGLGESVQKLYVEKDGKFYLDVDGHEKNETDRIPKSRLDQEIAKRKEAETELKTIADNLKADVPEDYQDLVPDLPPGKLIVWLRNASAKGLFNLQSQDSGIDSKRPGGKPPKDFKDMSPQAIMALGYKTK
jgi:hypothetical protein